MLNKPIREKAIALPFAVDYYGNINIATSQEKVWADRVRAVIGTMLEERVMRPEFGTEVPKLVWDTSDIAVEFIQKEINNAFSAYLPLLSVQSVETVFNEDENIITANIAYSLPNNEEVIETIGIATISPTGALTEDNL
jgi:phage baseplate assembly protein W